MGWWRERVQDLHDFGEKYVPLGTKVIDTLLKAEATVAREGARGLESVGRALGWQDLEDFGQHWEGMAEKDRQDPVRQLANGALAAAAIYGGMYAAGSGGAAGAGGVAESAGVMGATAGSGAGAGYSGAAAAGGSMGGWADIAQVGAGLYSASAQSRAAAKAAQAQSDAARASNATQLYMYDTTRADNMPALVARNQSLARMRELLGVGGDTAAQGYGSMSGSATPQDVQADPGYQFGLQQGQQALQRQASARGMLNSGNALMAAIRYGNDYAGTKYNEAWNRMQGNQTNTFNRLASVAGLGQTGASQIAASGSNAANNISANQIGVGNAQAAAGIASSNAWANSANQLAGWYANRNNGG